ncbi:hypothetical protein A2U01_0036024, partial [Trifolium medium]|nr:hypothetical protein [Trifolium medium]
MRSVDDVEVEGQKQVSALNR